MKCGAPWERLVEITFIQEKSIRSRGRTKGQSREKDAKSITMGDGGKIGHYEIRTIGWKPTCKCGAKAVPCIVADPFMGAATTAKVALRAGRNFLGIELNPEYVKMGNKRIEGERRQLKLF